MKARCPRSPGDRRRADRVRAFESVLELVKMPSGELGPRWLGQDDFPDPVGLLPRATSPKRWPRDCEMRLGSRPTGQAAAGHSEMIKTVWRYVSPPYSTVRNSGRHRRQAARGTIIACIASRDRRVRLAGSIQPTPPSVQMRWPMRPRRTALRRVPQEEPQALVATVRCERACLK